MKYKKPSEDLGEIKMGDKRLDKRLKSTVEKLEESSQKSILEASGTRHGAKAFYALLSNEKFGYEKVSEQAIKGTQERIKASGVRRILAVQDTSDINLNGHEKTEGLGYSSEKVKGVKTHNCIALTVEGTPLGLLGQSYETREEKKSKLSKREKNKRPIEEKESNKWLEMSRRAVSATGVETVIICDREGDFYELHSELIGLNTPFVIRLCQDRKTLDGEKSIQQLRRTNACGETEILIPRDTRKNIPARTATMEVACCEVAITRPKTASAELPDSLKLNLVRITEIGEAVTKKGEIIEPVEWLLATNLPVTSDKDIMEIVGYYVHRWKIEQFHKVLKSGCQVEKIQQRTYERIKPMLLIYSVIAVFILAMTYLSRDMPDAPCDIFLEEDEWKLLYCLINRTQTKPEKPYSLKTAVAYLGELGSFKHAPSDGDYGVKSIWQGLFKLYIALDVADRLMGQV